MKKATFTKLKITHVFVIILCLALFSCNEDINYLESGDLVTNENTFALATIKNPFTVGDVELISIADTEVRVQFTSSENSNAYIDYGVDINYGEQNSRESSLAYSTHRQYIKDLKSGTTYFYKIVTINEGGERATASGTFTTSGDGDGTSTPAFTVDGLELIKLEDTEVRIQFTASANAQAFIEYGTDTDYGSRTAVEESFDYATHRQYIKNLEPGTIYYYRVRVNNEQWQTASASGAFTTLGEPSGEEEEEEENEGGGNGMSSSFAQIQSQGLSNACYLDDEHYLAEFLYQNPEVYFWEIKGSEIVAVDTPVPSENAITLPAPSGGNDTAALERVINGNPGGEFVGRGVYRIDDLEINVPADIFDMRMVPASSNTGRIVNVKSKDVRIFNSPVDGQNSNAIFTAYEVEDGAHNFTLVKSGLKDVFHNRGANMSGVILHGVNDFHIAGNRFENLLNDENGNTTSAGRKVTARANAILMSGGNDASTSGGYIVNNYAEEFQSNGFLKDAEFFTIQGYVSTDEAKPVRLYANRTVNAGKRMVKFQESNGVVLSNYYEWNVKSGRLGDRSLLSHVTIHFSDNVFARNNRVKLGRDTESKFDYLFISDAKQVGNVQNNVHYDCNDILIESTLPVNDPRRPTLITARNSTSDRNGTGGEARNSTANDNVLRGPGTIANVYWFGEGYETLGGRFEHTGNIFDESIIIRGEYAGF